MKTFIPCILAAALALTCVCVPASAASAQDQAIATSTWDQILTVDDWDPVPTDSDYSVGIKLDKTVYSTENTVIKGELLNYSWDMEPDIVEIFWLDTGSVVYYSEAREASFTIDINLHPGKYLLRVRRGMDWNTYWNTYWSTYWDWNNSPWYPDSDEGENEDAGFYSYSTYFSVIGPSNLFHLEGTAQAEKYPDTEVLLSTRLEWDGLSGAGPYTVTQTDEKYEDKKVTYIEDIYDNYVVASGLRLGGIYTYTVSDGKKTSNPIVIDLSGIPPLEYAESDNDKVIVLKIGDPWMYSANDKQSALDGTGLEKITTIGGKDRGVVPILVNDRTMIPVAILVRKMGGSVDWDGKQRLVTIKAWDSTMMQYSTLEIPIDSKTVYLNGEEREFDTPAQIQRSRTLVPIRHLELLGYEVEWVKSSQSVVICYHEHK